MKRVKGVLLTIANGVEIPDEIAAAEFIQTEGGATTFKWSESAWEELSHEDIWAIHEFVDTACREDFLYLACLYGQVEVAGTYTSQSIKPVLFIEDGDDDANN